MKKTYFIIQIKELKKRKIQLSSGPITVTVPGHRWKLWTPHKFPTSLSALLYIRETNLRLKLYNNKRQDQMRVLMKHEEQSVISDAAEIKKLIKSPYRSVQLKCGHTV